jgi:tRNA(Ile)-lysidine synthase
MAFHRTDKGKISWPKGISAQDRRLCRRIYKLIEPDTNHNNILIGCSGGIDSTVLAHAVAMTMQLNGNQAGRYIAYVNHGLRSTKEIAADIRHVNTLATSLKYNYFFPKVSLEKGNTQALARKARYDALADIARKVGAKILLGHHANDVAETKLWQFLTGRPPVGMKGLMVWGDDPVLFLRPMLKITRQELAQYAGIWGLPWVEDSTNTSMKYTRNAIRKELIPWVEAHINPGIVKILAEV